MNGDETALPLMQFDVIGRRHGNCARPYETVDALAGNVQQKVLPRTVESRFHVKFFSG
jgi:hypothetical protein